ncbi:MAG: hypothetical protein IE909_02945 [Campylobacterales bacterium]|nr:hypothetical protein [Campylobacterales bacterium]
MDQSELNNARTNPEFLAYLDHRQQEVLESRSIAGLYEILDTLLILDLDEQRIHKVYEEILKISFDSIEERLKEDKKLSIDTDDIYFIRSFYEHAIEKWSMNNFDGAKELFFILTQIVEDEKLTDSFMVHLLSCAKSIDMDQFYDTKVNHEQTSGDDRYGYFIMDYTFDTKTYLGQNTQMIQEQCESMKHLLS